MATVSMTTGILVVLALIGLGSGSAVSSDVQAAAANLQQQVSVILAKADGAQNGFGVSGLRNDVKVLLPLVYNLLIVINGQDYVALKAEVEDMLAKASAFLVTEDNSILASLVGNLMSALRKVHVRLNGLVNHVVNGHAAPQRSKRSTTRVRRLAQQSVEEKMAAVSMTAGILVVLTLIGLGSGSVVPPDVQAAAANLQQHIIAILDKVEGAQNGFSVSELRSDVNVLLPLVYDLLNLINGQDVALIADLDDLLTKASAFLGAGKNDNLSSLVGSLVSSLKSVRDRLNGLLGQVANGPAAPQRRKRSAFEFAASDDIKCCKCCSATACGLTCSCSC